MTRAAGRAFLNVLRSPTSRCPLTTRISAPRVTRNACIVASWVIPRVASGISADSGQARKASCCRSTKPVRSSARNRRRGRCRRTRPAPHRPLSLPTTPTPRRTCPRQLQHRPRKRSALPQAGAERGRPMSGFFTDPRRVRMPAERSRASGRTGQRRRWLYTRSLSAAEPRGLLPS